MLAVLAPAVSFARMANNNDTPNRSVATMSTDASTVPRIHALLQREPSQQELEAAQQLVEHSQSGHAATTTSQAPIIAPNNGNYGPVSPGMSDSRTEQRVTPTSPQSERNMNLASSNHAMQMNQSSPVATSSPGGQMCSNCGTVKTPLWRRSPAGAVICNACGLYYKARNQMRPVGLKRGSGPNIPGTDVRSFERGPSPTSIQGGATYVSADQSVNGTCPGGGRCNGTGGHDGCSGCPAYNNRVSKTAQIALRQTNGPPHQNMPTGPYAQPVEQQAPASTNVVVACQNCGTTITPLWRRNEAGHTICNACGLYHKLHGAHRPVQMKKAEIKRRKRVVPAAQQGHAHHLNNASAPTQVAPSATSPMMSDAMSDISGPSDARQLYNDNDVEMRDSNGHARTGPIPVDFTGTFRKRTYSSIANDQPSLNGVENVATTLSNHNIDPSLPQTTAPADEKQARENRKAELRREAERMREMLMAKEKELAELGEEG